MVDDTKQIRKCSNLDCAFHCGMVNNDEFSGFLCSCLCMVDDNKTCVGNSLVWGSPQLFAVQWLCDLDTVKMQYLNF